MTGLVLDNSIVLSWCLADEDDALANRAMKLAIDHGAIVPGIWWYELRNALVVNERRGRIDAEDVRATLADLGEMRIALDSDHDDRIVLDLAQRHDLSVYDAAYLEVAMRRGLPIASLDLRLRRAAAACRIALIEPDISPSSR